MYPALKRISKAVPKEDLPQLALVGEVDSNGEKERIRTYMEERERMVKQIKEDYGTTKPGKEVAYLLGVRQDLLADLNSKKLENFVKYVGRDYDRCDFADQVKKFKNRDWQKWAKKLKSAVKRGGPRKVLNLISSRLHQLARARNKLVQNATEKANIVRDKIGPFVISEYLAAEQELQRVNGKIVEFNGHIENLNKDFKAVRDAFTEIMQKDTSEDRRKILTIETIVPSMDEAVELLNKINNVDADLKEMVRKDKQMLERLKKAADSVSRVIEQNEMLKQDVGTELTTETE
jgi:hypothetical protein